MNIVAFIASIIIIALFSFDDIKEEFPDAEFAIN